MSSKASKDAEGSAKDIGSSVERLEKIFDNLYSDTFAMMKDTVADMREHIWKNPNKNERRDLSINDAQLEDKIKNLLSNVNIEDDKEKNKIVDEIEGLVKKAIRVPNDIVVDDSVIIDQIKINGPLTLNELSENIEFDTDIVVPSIFNLGERGVLRWKGGPNSVRGDSVLRLNERHD